MFVEELLRIIDISAKSLLFVFKRFVVIKDVNIVHRGVR